MYGARPEQSLCHDFFREIAQHFARKMLCKDADACFGFTAVPKEWTDVNTCVVTSLPSTDQLFDGSGANV
jgi:hypothetical protein